MIKILKVNSLSILCLDHTEINLVKLLAERVSAVIAEIEIRQLVSQIEAKGRRGRLHRSRQFFHLNRRETLEIVVILLEKCCKSETSPQSEPIKPP
jgi:hypothetical protein